MHYVLNALRGALIGSAELVPGISGGTVALIVGIYERALHNANALFKLKFREVEWGFLASVAVGMLAAVFGLSTVIHSFVENQFSASHSMFMGMVFVSITVPLLMLSPGQRSQASTWIAFAVSTVAIFFVTGYTRTDVADPSYIVIFFAAAIAICALILPGVSGSLILLTMGLYAPVIGAVSERNFVFLAVFAAGALFGLAAFVRLLEYLLDNHRGPTLGAMAGFMLGSLRALWPFGAEQDAGAGTIIACFLLGAVVVSIFIVIDARKARATEPTTAA
ncbi:DUF368 domain-containing protein [Corynebacterium lizhenjunii]|uniref:DUF368 domain-containing protein n=1 Tax=Corynebacterium lizhenjunii TaxID=2709394 RepID=A0A7T0PAP5_9CORY|nr:DUF368 domain-containing protein [Corynebacterium lizhenjunii]QPK80098.1 DUF368 domain-containing protein [Corynebacterium lizhenjunii]